MRTLRGEVGLISEAQGSARLEYGETVVVASVYGPTQPRFIRHEEFDRAVIEVNFNHATPPVGKTGAGLTPSELARSEREGSRLILQVLKSCIDLKSCPRLLIVVDVSVLRDDGATLSAAINACSLAVMDSGIPMLYVPMSLTCLVGNGNLDMLDTSSLLEAKARSVITFAFRAVSSIKDSPHSPFSIIMTQASGVFETSMLENAWLATRSGAVDVKAFMNKVIRRV
jgi:exosome complex component RRP41